MIKGYFKTFVNGELVDEGKNTITNLGRKWLLDSWKSTGSPMVPWMDNGSAYLAVGEGSGLNLLGLSGLYNEIGDTSGNRAQFLSVSRGVDAGSQIIGSVTFAGSGARGLLTEVGLFVTGYNGATLKTASTTKDSGILFGRRAFNSTVTINSGTVLELQYKYTLWGD